MKKTFAVLALAASAVALPYAQQAPAVRALTEKWPEVVKVEGIEILSVQGPRPFTRPPSTLGRECRNSRPIASRSPRKGFVWRSQ